MEKIISGRIFYINEEERMIGLKVKDRQSYFYLQRSLLNKIGKYLELSRFIQFVIEDQPRIYKKTKVYTVEYIIKIMAIRYRKNIVYYDIKKIKNGTNLLFAPFIRQTIKIYKKILQPALSLRNICRLLIIIQHLNYIIYYSVT